MIVFEKIETERAMAHGKKYAVLLCAEDSDYVKKKYGGYFGVFVRMLGEEGESWDLYRVAEGDFPQDDEIESYDGFVISGSSKDAHGNDLWISKLLNLLFKLDSIKKQVLGICFGHQVFFFSSFSIFVCLFVHFQFSSHFPKQIFFLISKIFFINSTK